MVSIRALRSRGLQSAALFVIGTLGVAGGVVAVGYSRLASVSIGSAVALLVVGMVAVAAQSSASVQARQQEIALAQLRGSRGLRLLVFAVAEPIAVLVAAAVTGTLLGRLLAQQAVARWVTPGPGFEMSATEWTAVAVAFAVSVAVVVAVSWRSTYEPLNTKLGGLNRPRPATWASLFVSLLILLAAAVSVYQSRQTGPGRADWVGLLSPALVGLAGGQLAIWGVALLARMATAPTASRARLGWFLTVRRLTRRGDSVAVLRVAVAAIVIAGVAANAWVASASWRYDMARMQTAGPVRVSVPAGGLQAYAASREADPQGRWLMAMSASFDPSGGSYRDVFVDTPRWDRVVGSFFADSAVGQVTSPLGALAPDTSSAAVVKPVQAREFSVTLTAESVDHAWPRREINTNSDLDYGFVPLQFTLNYVDDSGDSQLVDVPKNAEKAERPSPVAPGLVGYSVPLPGCTRACAVVSVDVRGLTGFGRLRVTELSVGDQPLLGAASGLTPVGDKRTVQAVSSDGGLDLELRDPFSTHPLLVWPHETDPAALVTPGLRLEKAGRQPLAYGIDGRPQQVQIAGEVPALPLLGRGGLLLDLGTALRGAGGQIPADTISVVVARADTPASVLAKLRATGATGKSRTVAQALDRIERTGTAKGTRLYLLIALFALLIAAVRVVAATVEQRRERRTEAAALRVAGVGVGEIARGYRGEAQALGLSVAVASGVAVWVGCRALLAALPLVDPGEFGLVFDVTPDVGVVTGLSAAAGLFVALVVFGSFRRIGRSSPPRLLREGDR